MTTSDKILGGKVSLNQPREGYRAAIDPVLLAACVRAKPGEKAMDLGCGVGAVMLCLAARVSGLKIDGLEIQPHLVQLARDNVKMNGFSDHMAVFEGDILSPPVKLERESYHHVFANPPFISTDRGHPPPNDCKRIAHVEGHAGLKDWVAAALSFCRPKGSVAFIYRADRLDDLIINLHGQAGEIEIIPLWPKSGEPAKRVIVRARKGLKTPLILSAGLVLHDDDGSYGNDMNKILKGDLTL